MIKSNENFYLNKFFLKAEILRFYKIYRITRVKSGIICHIPHRATVSKLLEITNMGWIRV